MESIVNATNLIDWGKKSFDARQSLRNQVRCLKVELIFNYEILRAYKGKTKNEDISEDEPLFIEEDDDKLNDTDEMLLIILEQLKSNRYEEWMRSNHNLDRLGWISPTKETGSKELKIRYWDFLSKLYGRVEYLSIRLKIQQKHNNATIRMSKVNSELHLKRIAESYKIALIHIDRWYKQKSITHLIKNWFRLTT